MDVKQLLSGSGAVFFDGAMGTLLQEKGLKLGELPELINLKKPEVVLEIHQGYLAAGAQIITTNTFGANDLKLKNTGFSVEEVVDAGVSLARQAANGHQALVALDIGPLGELLEPMGTLKFETAYQHFKKQIVQGQKSGVDLIIIETMADLYEVKAAVLAAKENSNLPVFCTMSFEDNLRTFTGCSIESMVMVLQGLGVAALGVNCSLGPQQLEPVVERLAALTNLPIIVQANAGLPKVEQGETAFDLTPEEFAAYGRRFAERGVKILGGCCGTTFQHIQVLVAQTKDVVVPQLNNPYLPGVCTPLKPVILDSVQVVGERINPTGKKAFQAALRNKDFDYVLREALRQVEAGADILDVNVGLPEIDEEQTMVQVIKEIQAILDVPLQIDSSDPQVIESALRVYNGKAIVNSVTGEDKILAQVLPIVKKYGAAVIGLTLDEHGIPPKAEERVKIAEKIVKRAESYGIPKEDVYIDCLALTAAAQQEAVKETVKALYLVKEKLQVKTVLGVSNISFGLSNRDLLNRTFLAACLTAGLDLPIINPLDVEMMDTIAAFKVLWGIDSGANQYWTRFKQRKHKATGDEVKSPDSLQQIIIQGSKELAKAATSKLMKVKTPLAIIDQDIIPALDLVGQYYEKGQLFLPQLIQSAETVKESFALLKQGIEQQAAGSLTKGKIVLGTVKGDIHDIGKNIVKVLLESYGFQVIDLGKDVPAEAVVEAAIQHQVRLVGLSALMTTTVKSMEETIAALRKAHPSCQVMVGGAVLNQEYADFIGADYYGKDAKTAVAIAQKVYRE